ncbi:MAG: hypothetical protein AAGC65_22620 [Mucilaginibacter sp.]|uniref:hypothetical protein n=1 Tax=Mucilaginibacter sp. TaxID=1882438 RepID=UPI0031A1343D
MTKRKLIRYILSLIIIGLMVGVSEWLEQPEILFPEISALVLGLWVVDKQIWTISKPMFVLLLTVSAVFGVLLVRYSPFPALVNVAISFTFTSFCLIISRTTLVPITSAALLPLLLGTDSFIYPLSVFIMSVLVVLGQWLLVKKKPQQVIIYRKERGHHEHRPGHWIKLLFYLLIIGALPLYTGNPYFIVPPLITMFIEFSTSSAGFRNRPLQVYLLIIISAILGAMFQYYLHIKLGVSLLITVLLLFVCLFFVFEVVGKIFVPACAIALVPMIIPVSRVLSYPLQVAIGAGVFLFVSMFFFQKCYRWKRPHLLVCFVPAFVRSRIQRPGRK